MSPFKGIIIVTIFFYSCLFYVEAVPASLCRALQKTRVSIAGRGPALCAVLEGLRYYNSPDNSPSRSRLVVRQGG